MLIWFIELVLDSIPTWIWPIGAISGLIVFLLSGIIVHFPAVGIYARFVKPVAGLITLFCVFMYGGAGVQAMWQSKVAAAQEKVKKAEEDSAAANAEIEKLKKKKQQVVTKYIDRIKQEIVVQKEAIDAKCQLPPEAVTIINGAARIKETK